LCSGIFDTKVIFDSAQKISPYNADVIAAWANEIGPFQLSNRHELPGMVCYRIYVLYVFRCHFEQPVSHQLRLTPAFRPGTTNIMKVKGFSHNPAWPDTSVRYQSDQNIFAHHAEIIAVYFHALVRGTRNKFILFP
jgi:hypothetical protein